MLLKKEISMDKDDLLSLNRYGRLKKFQESIKPRFEKMSLEMIKFCRIFSEKERFIKEFFQLKFNLEEIASLGQLLLEINQMRKFIKTIPGLTLVATNPFSHKNSDQASEILNGVPQYLNLTSYSDEDFKKIFNDMSFHSVYVYYSFYIVIDKNVVFSIHFDRKDGKHSSYNDSQVSIEEKLDLLEKELKDNPKTQSQSESYFYKNYLENYIKDKISLTYLRNLNRILNILQKESLT